MRTIKRILVIKIFFAGVYLGTRYDEQITIIMEKAKDYYYEVKALV